MRSYGVASIASRLARAAVVGILVLAPTSSWAGDRALIVELQYSAAPDCPEVGEFRGIVVGRLGYDPFREGAANLIVAQVVPRGQALEGHIEWRDTAGKWRGDRTFPSHSGDCHDLVRAMAFALALQIQLLTSAVATPNVIATPPPENVEIAEAPRLPLASPEPGSPHKAEAAPPVLTPTSEGHARVARPHVFAVGVGGWAGSGISSNMVEFARVFGSVAWPLLSLEFGAELGLPATIRRQDGAGFSHRELLASLAGCGTQGRWSECLVAKGGQIKIAGKDIESPTSHSGPFVQVGLRLAVMQNLWRRAFVVAKAEGLATLTGWRVTLDRTLVWTSPRFAGTLGLDVGVRFE